MDVPRPSSNNKDARLELYPTNPSARISSARRDSGGGGQKPCHQITTAQDWTFNSVVANASVIYGSCVSPNPNTGVMWTSYSSHSSRVPDRLPNRLTPVLGVCFASKVFAQGIGQMDIADHRNVRLATCSGVESLRGWLKNYCACQYGVAKDLKMLMYTPYIPLSRPFAPCLGCARYVFQQTLRTSLSSKISPCQNC